MAVLRFLLSGVGCVDQRGAESYARKNEEHLVCGCLVNKLGLNAVRTFAKDL